MIDFLAVLNYEHLDNGLFLTSFAKSLKKREKRGLILHEVNAIKTAIKQAELASGIEVNSVNVGIAGALNKITKDRYLPTGPELFHSAQLIDISGLNFRFFFTGEPI